MRRDTPGSLRTHPLKNRDKLSTHIPAHVPRGTERACSGRKRASGARAVETTEPLSAAPAAFPSARQAACAGLRREYYPAYLRDMVDYDYDEDLRRRAAGGDALAKEALVFLAAFSEEFYKGFRLKRETQIHGLTHLREAGAQKQRRRRQQDVLSFGAHRSSAEPEPKPLSKAAVEEEIVSALDDRRAAAGGRR
jgi:hypothetical protein